MHLQRTPYHADALPLSLETFSTATAGTND